MTKSKFKQFLLGDASTYWDKLSDEEKDWLYKFELATKTGTGIHDLPFSDETKKELNHERYARQNDLMNVSKDKVDAHTKSKSTYGPEDYFYEEEQDSDEDQIQWTKRLDPQ